MNTNQQKRVAIYIRVSSDEQAKEGYSPQTQEEKIKEFIKTNDYKLDKNHVYVDLGWSGGTEKRPGLQKLLNDARMKEFDMVIVYRMDRFFRNLRLLLNTVAELKELGIEFKSITEPYDTSTPTGRAMFTHAATFGEWMREVGLESRNEGMTKAMKAGKWLGGTPPYGYRLNRKTQKLEIDEEEKPVIENIFNWLVIDRLSEYKIHKKLNEMKVPTKYDRLGRKKKTNTKCWWNKRALGRILRNQIYTGSFYYRQQKYLGRVKGKNNLRPKEEWILVKDPGIQIISLEMFERAQKQLKKNRELSPRKTKEIYALQHKIICGYDNYKYQCALEKYTMKNGTGKKKYYFCPATRSAIRAKKCPSSAVSESRILPAIWAKLKELLSDPDKIMKEINLYASRGNRKNKILEKIKSIEELISSYSSERFRWSKLFAKGLITEEESDKEISGCKKEMEDLEKEKERQSFLLLAEEEKEKRKKSINELYLKLKQELENTNYKTQKEIIGWLIEKIIKTGNELEIEFRLPFNIENAVPASLNIIPSFYNASPRVD